MDYERNKSYRQKSNTGFWVVAVLTLLLSGYMLYSHFLEFTNYGMASVESYVYGREEMYQTSSAKTVINLILGGCYLLIFLLTGFAALKKHFRVLSIAFLSAIVLSIIVFMINEIIF